MGKLKRLLEKIRKAPGIELIIVLSAVTVGTVTAAAITTRNNPPRYNSPIYEVQVKDVNANGIPDYGDMIVVKANGKPIAEYSLIGVEQKP